MHPRLGRWLFVLSLLGTGGCVGFDHGREEGPLSPVEVEQKLSWDGFDERLLATAIFAETNRVRRSHDLPRLRAYPRLVEAANLQAYTIALTGVATHDNPLAGRAKVWDRIEAIGIPVAMAMENVASTLARVSPSGSSIRVTLDPEGTRVRRDEASGEELPWPTYEEAARRIVQQWMESPGHRNNILNPEVRRLACGTALSRSALGGEMIHSVQVFLTAGRRR